MYTVEPILGLPQYQNYLYFKGGLPNPLRQFFPCGKRMEALFFTESFLQTVPEIVSDVNTQKQHYLPDNSSQKLFLVFLRIQMI